MLAKLQQLIRLPRQQRNSRLKIALQNRLNAYINAILFSLIGYWSNRITLRLVLQYRPDFHAVRKVPEYAQLYQAWVKHNRANNSGDLTRFYTIYLNVNQILDDGVPGDVVELGVYKGNSAALLATLARRKNRHLYLFDTFAGFDSRDLHGIDGAHPVIFTDTSVEAVRDLVGTEGVSYVQGFFPESTSQVRLPEQIAIAHIDCDLYEPMKAGLECFYPRLAPGGILLLHDYASGCWPGAKRAIDEFFENRPEKPILAADKSGTALIRRMAANS